MTVTGPDFIALQVRDLERAATFYQDRLGLRRAAVSPPHAIVFDTSPVALAVRDPLPGIDLDAVPQLGIGVALWLHADDAQAIHDKLVDAEIQIIAPPSDGPFGRTFTFRDLDGYAITIHDQA